MKQHEHEPYETLAGYCPASSHHHCPVVVYTADELTNPCAVERCKCGSTLNREDRMSTAKHTQAVVAWSMWKARKARNAHLHAQAVQRYTVIVNTYRPTLTVLSVSERYINLQCTSCGARLSYSTRQVKRLSPQSTNSVRCKDCTVKPAKPCSARDANRSSPSADYLRHLFTVQDGVLVYHDHSLQRDHTPFGAVKWLKRERRSRRYGYVKGHGYFYADDLIAIMEADNAPEEASRSESNT